MAASAAPGLYVKSRFSEAERLAIAADIRDHMARNGIARKTLERPDLKKGIIDKALVGGFSDETLCKIEAALSRRFGLAKAAVSSTEAPKALGGYSREDAEELEGDYLCIRPTFANPSVLSAYKMSLRWDEDRHCLRFSESQRFDGKYSQSGDVYNPPKKPFFNLLTIDCGSVRLITLSMPDDCGISRGILTTLNNPHGVIFTPTAAPIVLVKSQLGYFRYLGLIEPGSEHYGKARDLVDSVAVEECAQFIAPAEQQTHAISHNI